MNMSRPNLHFFQIFLVIINFLFHKIRENRSGQVMKKNKIIAIIVIAILIFGFSLLKIKLEDAESISANSTNLSNKKIGWGIKRNDNHEQPDLGKENRRILEENKGIAMGNSEKKYIYLTFDEGYEAGYTKQILQTLEEENVKATFFITAHYLNTQSELVKQMIDEGHIVGNHTPKFLMSGNDIETKC